MDIGGAGYPVPPFCNDLVLYASWIVMCLNLLYPVWERGEYMDQVKVGALIRRLRNEKGFTQSQLAERLLVSAKAVSKWENGQGLPDISLIAPLAETLGVELKTMLAGELGESKIHGGNMNRIRFYVCPVCGNVITMTGKADVSCCGRQLEALKPVACDEAHTPHLEHMDGELYITFDHPMEKAHYIQFVACVRFDRVMLVRLYPEQGAELRMPYIAKATYYVGCSQEGLFVHKT